MSISTQLSRTEIVDNTCNPDYATTFTIDYLFEELQVLHFEVYDCL